MKRSLFFILFILLNTISFALDIPKLKYLAEQGCDTAQVQLGDCYF